MKNCKSCNYLVFRNEKGEWKSFSDDTGIRKEENIIKYNKYGNLKCFKGFWEARNGFDNEAIEELNKFRSKHYYQFTVIDPLIALKMESGEKSDQNFKESMKWTKWAFWIATFSLLISFIASGYPIVKDWFSDKGFPLVYANQALQNLRVKNKELQDKALDLKSLVDSQAGEIKRLKKNQKILFDAVKHNAKN